MALAPSNPKYFRSPRAFRQWLEKHHDSAPEVWVGFWKKHTGKPSLTWPEAVDQALCFGWIDGIMKRVDDERHVQRFTPRRPKSVWSKVNVDKVKALTTAGLMHPAGLTVFKARGAEHRVGYSVAARDEALDPAYEKRFRASGKGWTWFRKQPPGYRRTAVHWVMSAKREATRERRLAQLIGDSAEGQAIPPLRQR